MAFMSFVKLYFNIVFNHHYMMHALQNLCVFEAFISLLAYSEPHFKQIAQKANHTLFNNIKYLTPCLNQLLPPTRNTQHILRDREHLYILPSWTFNCTSAPLSISACLVILAPD